MRKVQLALADFPLAKVNLVSAGMMLRLMNSLDSRASFSVVRSSGVNSVDN